MRAAPFASTPRAPDETVRDGCTRWVADRDARGIVSVRTDRARLRTHVFPRIGSRPVAKVTREELEDLVTHLDRRVRAGQLSWRTALSIWALVSKLFSDACRSKDRSLRARPDNPAAEVRAPDRGPRKAKVYLYPSEFLALVRCPQVPLATRRLYAVAIYTFARAGELEVLCWSDLDLDHGTAHLHVAMDRDRKRVKPTKSSMARRIALEPTLLPLLRAMRAEDAGEGRLFPRMPREASLAVALRKHLRVAGVQREDLFVNDATRKNMTFHDLRASGITWAAVRGDDLSKIQRRAGHSAPSTTDLYIREAETARVGFGEVFPPLPETLLRLPVATAEVPDDDPGTPDVDSGPSREGGSDAPGANRSGNRSAEMVNGPKSERFRAVGGVRGGGLESEALSRRVAKCFKTRHFRSAFETVGDRFRTFCYEFSYGK